MFQSFFLGGFEGSTGYNIHHQWFDQIEATQHDRFVNEDYARLQSLGIRAVREAVRWPLIDREKSYDFSSLQPFIEAGKRHGIEIIFDLFHFGYPQHINLFSDEFPKRFADYCYAVTRYISRQIPGRGYYTPVNEPSFFSWAAGEMGLFAPHKIGRGFELKMQLIKAAIAGIEAIRAANSQSRMVSVDPLCRVALPPNRPEMADAVQSFNDQSVFQSWDILSGRLFPELGGSPKHLDIVGINYYWTNQWEWGKTGKPLADTDPRRLSLRQLIAIVWERYRTEMLVTETSHVNDMRPVWLNEMTGEVEAVLNEEIPLRGVCLYPILGMPEWHFRDEWTRLGLWDLVEVEDGLKRVPFPPMLEAFKAAQRLENHVEWQKTTHQKSRSIAYG
ncbi:MAG: glycoside hydrolase [Acidobacteriota bacterium]